MLRLFLVRHGKIDAGEGLYIGHSDVPLSQEGIDQAERTKARLAREKITAVYSSDLSRARRTAEIIASAHNLTVSLNPKLRELNFGLMEGKSYLEIRGLYPALSTEWFAGPDFALPGGESLKDVEKRLKTFLHSVVKSMTDENVLLVSHKGAIRVLVCILMGLPPQDYWKIAIDHASLTVVDTYPEGGILQLLNDTSHLILFS